MSENKTLAQWSLERRAIADILTEIDGILDDAETERIVDAWMLEIKSGIATKIDGYKFKTDALASTAADLKAQAKKFTDAAKALENLQERIKDRLKEYMVANNSFVLEGNAWIYKLSKGPPSVVVLDESQIPAIYTREKVTVEIDKAAIKHAVLIDKKTIKGVSVEHGFTLRTSINKGENK